MSRPDYYSVFAPTLNAYLDHRIRLGYQVDNEKYYLALFDRFCVENGVSTPVLEKSMLDKWCSQRPNEADGTHYNRVNLTRQLLMFMLLSGLDVIVPRNVRYLPSSFVPHIYTQEQTANYIAAADNLVNRRDNHISRLVPVLVRVLIGCGTRITETLSIRVCDVNADNGVITLKEVKGGHERKVVPHDSLAEILLGFISRTAGIHGGQDYVFASRNGTHVSGDFVYEKHRLLLAEAGIPYIGGLSGPRIHDWRHTFAVNAFKQMSDNGADMYVALPILSAYLGHKTIYATERYVRLALFHFPELAQKLENITFDILEEDFNGWD